MRFSKEVVKNRGSIQVTIPADLVRSYKIKEGDIVEFDIIRNGK